MIQDSYDTRQVCWTMTEKEEDVVVLFWDYFPSCIIKKCEMVKFLATFPPRCLPQGQGNGCGGETFYLTEFTFKESIFLSWRENIWNFILDSQGHYYSVTIIKTGISLSDASTYILVNSSAFLRKYVRYTRVLLPDIILYRIKK